MSKDWTGNAVSMFKTLGASNHATHDRQAEDYYATEPKATEWLCKLESFKGPILEPSCGEGHMAKVLMAHGYEVVVLAPRAWIFLLSTTPHGRATSLPIRPTSSPWSLCARLLPLFPMGTRLPCS